MQAIGGTIVANVGGDRARSEACRERLAIGELMDEAARLGGGNKGRASSRHDG